MFYIWVYVESTQNIMSISSQEVAARLAEEYPECIYFFAELGC